MSKKNKNKNTLELDLDDVVNEGVEEATEEIFFDYDRTAYVPVWNATYKRYDMLLLRIDTVTEQVVFEREPLRTDSIYVAAHEVLRRTQNELLGRNK